MSDKICVIGEGSWGTAFACMLADNGYEINLWCHNTEIAKSINQTSVNAGYFPNHILDKKIIAHSNFEQALEHVEWIFVAIPVKYLREIFQKTKNYFNQSQKWILLSKGCEKETFFFPSQIIDDVFQTNVNKAVISGPSFADELIKKKLTAVDVALSNNYFKDNLKKILTSYYFKINISDDLIGIQSAGAFKNVVAIIMGIIKAKNYSDNTKAYIFTKCIEEMKVLIKFFGGKQETLLGLSGIGDLILTCFGNYSKNLKLGIQLGTGKKIEEFENLPEGVNTIASINELIQKNNLELPLFKELYKFIFLDSNLDNLYL